MKEKRKPLGRVIDRTDEEIDALSAVTPAMIEEARDWWHENAPPGFEGMVDAETKEVER